MAWTGEDGKNENEMRYMEMGTFRVETLKTRDDKFD